jgi:hypothetical protein
MAKSYWDALAHFHNSIAFSVLYCLRKTMISDSGARRWCETDRSHHCTLRCKVRVLVHLIVHHLSGRHLVVYRPCSLHIRVFSEVGIFSWLHRPSKAAVGSSKNAAQPEDTRSPHTQRVCAVHSKLNLLPCLLRPAIFFVHNSNVYNIAIAWVLVRATWQIAGSF